MAAKARRLMACYEALGCKPIYSCAPYQTMTLHGMPRPHAGQQIAWAESNAIVFANSVLGARTNRYGDFLDICCALTGRAPACGLHLDEPRLATVVVRLQTLPQRLLDESAFYPVLGYWLGRAVGARVPALVGLPEDLEEDRLKALGAAAASSGSLAMFHVVGRTPEAPTLADALGGRSPVATLELDAESLHATLERLSTAERSAGAPVQAVALGSPHYSFDEIARLVPRVEANPPAAQVELVVCTSRAVSWALDHHGLSARLTRLGVRIVTDTCVVVAPVLRTTSGVLMTDSAKFAHYAPANLGLDVVFASQEECVRSAARAQVWCDDALWGKNR